MGVSWMVKVVGVVGVVGVRTQGLAPSCPALRPLPSSTSHDPRLISHNLKKHRVSSCVSVTDEGLKNEVHPRHIQEDTRCFFKLWHTDHLDHPINTHPPARTYMGVPKPKPTAPSHPLNQGPKPWDRACGPKLQRAACSDLAWLARRGQGHQGWHRAAGLGLPNDSSKAPCRDGQEASAAVPRGGAGGRVPGGGAH
eukprot:4033338-Pyramimonas_sp.AAC.1